MRRHLSFWLFFCLVFLVFTGEGVRGEDKYPSRAIELVVPFAAGGGTSDLTARAYSDNLAKLLKVPVTVVHRGGGTGDRKSVV
jgi:tripartite-type tricarboxylate transporter receptor subunit TctC